MNARATTGFDVVVIGAGPAGAATAILLARAGWSVALVERQLFPRRKVCGECIAASNLPLLDALDAGSEFARLAGAELRRVALMRGRETITAALPPAESTTHPFGRALGRERLDTLLVVRAKAVGATVLQPCTVQAIEGGPGRFRVRAQPLAETRRVHELEAGLVVAANGSWQPLPDERTGWRAARRRSDLFAFKANFAGTSLAPDLLPVLSFDGGYGGMVVEGGGRATLACCVRADRLQRERAARPSERAGDVVEAMLRRETCGVAAALRGAERDGEWLASGPLRPGVHLGAGDGLFRVGNAAGEAHPIVGEGISMALQSAFLLASLACGKRAALVDPATAESAQSRLLRHYEMRWRRRFVPRLAVAALFAHAAMRPPLSMALWPVARMWPCVLTNGARWSGKTRCAPEAMALAAAIPSPACGRGRG